MINILKKIGWFLKKEKITYITMIILLLLIAFLSLIPAFVIGIAIDTIVSDSLTATTLTYIVIALTLIPVTRYASSYIYHFTINKLSQKLAHSLRLNYLNKLFTMDAEFFEKYTKGDLISRVTSDLESVTLAATSLIEGIIFNVGVIFFAIFIMSFTISWQLTLISVSIMPIGLSILNYIRHNKRKYIKIHREIYANMTEKILESVEGQKTIRAYVYEDTDLNHQKDAIKKDIESWRYIVKFENWFNPMFEVVYGIAYILAFIFGVYFIIEQTITIGQLITFVSYIGILYGPIIAVSNIFNQINNATIGIDRYGEIMSQIPSVKDDEESESLIDIDKIEFRNVTFKYPFDSEPMIKDVSFTIHKGQTIGIVGPTGSGKSTIIRQLLRDFDVSSGQILFNNKDIKKYKLESIRQLVGYVPQSHMLFKRGVHANILIGNPKANQEQLWKAVRAADFEKDLNFLQDGLNTLVGESGSTLSGGQKQRLSIARALVKDPEILILDDSLSAVDANTEENIIEQLKEVRSDKTNIIIAHRFSAVRDADLILVIQKGEITQRGTHLELLKSDGWYKDQYIKQMQVK